LPEENGNPKVEKISLESVIEKIESVPERYFKKLQ
jgi:hypothetical protein